MVLLRHEDSFNFLLFVKEQFLTQTAWFMMFKCVYFITCKLHYSSWFFQS